MQFDIDMKSEHKTLFNSARKVLLEKYKLKETKKDRITTYSDDFGGICHMRTMKYGIDIGFLKGAHMEDDYGLLTGSGKVMRVFPVRELDVTQVQYYLEQAILINANK
ncbi:hypothetical protein N9J84_01065 [Porticoccaceae bacterium]|nr:hypothetical protein [Porticoccaceae bacterium]